MNCYSLDKKYSDGENKDLSFGDMIESKNDFFDDIVYTDYQLSDKFAELFFIQYYTHYLKGGKPCEALQISKKYFIENTKYSHPFFWYCIKSI